MNKLCGFVPKFHPLYYLLDTVKSLTHSNGGQRSGRLSGGNARERTSLGRHPEVLSQWPEYNNFNN